MAHHQISDGEDCIQHWKLAGNIMNKQQQTADKGWSSCLVIGCGSDIYSTLKNLLKMLHRPLDFDRFFGMTEAKENGH
jgi:hypothetical protein